MSSRTKRAWNPILIRARWCSQAAAQPESSRRLPRRPDGKKVELPFFAPRMPSLERGKHGRTHRFRPAARYLIYADPPHPRGRTAARLIVKRVKQASRDGIAIEDGSLYPALNRMLVKGWLAAEWGISENNRKARFYRLTPEGRKQLTQEAEEFNRMVRAIQLVMRTV